MDETFRQERRWAVASSSDVGYGHHVQLLPDPTLTQTGTFTVTPQRPSQPPGTSEQRFSLPKKHTDATGTLLVAREVRRCRARVVVMAICLSMVADEGRPALAWLPATAFSGS